VVGKPIKWDGLRDSKSDLCTTRPSGYWDVMRNFDSRWHVRSPEGRQDWGYSSRSEARIEAERQIRVREASKVCGICRAAKRRASWTCRACGRKVCEHLCGYKSGSEATCTKCSMTEKR